MTLWSAAEESDWPSRWPKTASTGTQIAPPQASWRWTSLNCWETVNMRWGRQVSNHGKIWQLIGEGRIISLCLFASLGSNSAGQHVCVEREEKHGDGSKSETTARVQSVIVLTKRKKKSNCLFENKQACHFNSSPLAPFHSASHTHPSKVARSVCVV